ncbi:MAG: type IV pilus secretin PilQ [Deltaproteobacteria bacterium]|nr:type IV pilus secretin PilQ [Deltaproteobacteria bacterium]
MRKTERDERWGAAAGLLSILLLGFIGCTKVLERQVTSVSPESDAGRPAVASNGFLNDFPTEPPPAASATSLVDDAPSSASQPALEHFQTALEETLRVHEIQLAERDGREALILVLSRPPDRVRSFSLSNPDRMVLDLDGPQVVTSPQTHPVVDPAITRVRFGGHDAQLRVVIDLKGALPAVSTEQDGRIVVALLGPTRPGSKDQLVYRAPGLARAALVAIDDLPADAVIADAPVADPGVPAVSEPAAPPVELAAADEAAHTDDLADVPHEPLPEPPAIASAKSDIDPSSASAHATDDLGSPSASAKDDLVFHEPPPEKPTTYALPVQATTKSESRKTPPITHTVEGGTVQQLGPYASGPHEYTGQRISLDFKDADIQNVLRILVDVSGLNIITAEEVQGKLTMRLVDVPWDQAFDAILRAKNLDSVREGNIVRVSTVAQLKKERDAQRDADEAQKQVEPLEVKYIKVNYAKADEKLVKKIQDVLTDRGKATSDERTNMIVVRDISRGIAEAGELIRQFDTQTPQVLIESNIVEAQKGFLRDLGVQWGIATKAGPGTGNSTGLNFPGTINAGGVLAGGKNSPATTIPFIADFPAASVAPGAGTAYDILLGSIDGSTGLDARLTALETDNKIKIISRPRVVTLNNQPATIEALRILRVPLPSTGTVIATGAAGVAGSSQTATEKINTGITLTVTPQVSSDGFIFLDVFAKSSTTAPSSVASNTVTVPDEISRQAESHVLIKDGETFVLGGVYTDNLTRSEQGIPYLRSIPVLGWAFKSHKDNDERTELLVFVTPKTVGARGAEDVAQLPSAEILWQNRSR